MVAKSSTTGTASPVLVKSMLFKYVWHVSQTHTRNFRRRIKRHLRLSLFSARRTIHSPKSPLVRAQHADQRFLRAVTFAPQDAHDRFPSAQRTSRRRSIHDRVLALIGQTLGIRLQKNPRQ